MNDDLLTTYAAPLSGASPCGENLEYDPRAIELDEQYAGEPEHMMGDAYIPAAPPDWRKLEKAAAQLMRETRDLRILVIWTVASLANRGLSGLCDGLSLIDHLSGQQWDTLWPVPDDGDVQERLSALTRLSPIPGSFDADTTVLQLLLNTPLTASPALGAYALKDIRQAPENSDSARTIKAALRDTPAGHLQTLLAELDTSIELLRSIRDTYSEHAMGTPDFTMLTDLLKDMQLFLHSAPAVTLSSEPAAAASPADGAAALPEGTTPGSPDTSATAPAASTATATPAAAPSLSPAASAPLPAIATPPALNTRDGREQAIRIMEQLCAWFEENEPSSPVPYFLRRAIRAVGANFLDLISDIAPHAQDQINTILKPQTTTPAATPAPQTDATAPASTPTSPSSQPAQTEFFSPFG